MGVRAHSKMAEVTDKRSHSLGGSDARLKVVDGRPRAVAATDERSH